MKKLLILGAGGMLGHVVYTYLDSLNKYEIINSSHHNKAFHDSVLLDVTNKSKLESFILKIEPDIIVNCIGILIKGSKDDSTNAIYLNSYLPHQLEKVLFSYGGKLIHISTDCVFTGNKGNYIETDNKDARDTYGLSKALGEVDNNHDLTIRTSIIGPELKNNGEGLFHWFLNQSGNVNGFTKMIWGGVTTLELAKVIDATIEQNITGLIHITNGQPITKHELILLLNDIWKNGDLKIIPMDGKIVDKSLKSIRIDLNYSYKSYRDMLTELYDWMLLNMNIYTSYYK